MACGSSACRRSGRTVGHYDAGRARRRGGDAVGGATDIRRLPPGPSGDSLYWAGLNKASQSVEIDTSSPEGRKLVGALVGGSCHESVFVDETAQNVVSPQPGHVQVLDAWGWRSREALGLKMTTRSGHPQYLIGRSDPVARAFLGRRSAHAATRSYT